MELYGGRRSVAARPVAAPRARGGPGAPRWWRHAGAAPGGGGGGGLEPPPGRGGAEVGVGQGVDADLVALVDDPAGKLGVGDDLGADDEEGRVHAVLAQDVEDLRRGLGVRAVVEGQRDGALGRPHGLDAAAAGVDDRPAVGHGVGDARARLGGRRRAAVADAGDVVHVALDGERDAEREEQGDEDGPVGPDRRRAWAPPRARGRDGGDASGAIGLAGAARAHGFAGAVGRVSCWPGADWLLPGSTAAAGAASAGAGAAGACPAGAAAGACPAGAAAGTAGRATAGPATTAGAASAPTAE